MIVQAPQSGPGLWPGSQITGKPQPTGKSQAGEPIIEVKGLYKSFAPKAKPLIYAVRDLNLAVGRGEILGLVGESGCGKTTLGKLMLRLERPTQGQILFGGQDIATLGFTALRAIRHRMQMIFQGTANAFNPYYSVNRIIGEPLENYARGASFSERTEMVVSLLAQVGLGPEYLGRYPSEMSGGQRQRVGIARALILNPEFVVCDESVSSVDHAAKDRILELLANFRRERGCSYLFISHDLASVAKICDRVAVMYLGNLVEVLPRPDSPPLHPYTQALAAAFLSPDPRRRGNGKALFKDGAEIGTRPAGCPFSDRCLYAMGICHKAQPLLTDRGDGRLAACHLESNP
ncbi:MAG: ABC transporter ATP-binding protein [Deltaproteobacteria bacterium]|jgi:peptide/nickel transport system ATP-binding protein/oligopeptide transport system ATP-binding protein|nr:ABC transporter ATP-binding protein [Deltaproteobacteria bacterium]